MPSMLCVERMVAPREIVVDEGSPSDRCGQLRSKRGNGWGMRTKRGAACPRLLAAADHVLLRRVAYERSRHRSR